MPDHENRASGGETPLLELHNVSKHFGGVMALKNVDFTLKAGEIHGLVGENGAGKSTTMRLMLGLDRGEGHTDFDGKPLRDHAHPSRVVGTHLDARPFLPGRTARDHLRMLATEAKLPASSIDHVLAMVGLTEVADERMKTKKTTKILAKRMEAK